MTRKRYLTAECGQRHDASNGKPFKHDCYTFDVGRLAAHARKERLKQEPYCTTFCNHPHDLRDGKPIGHECYVLSVDVLDNERDGIFDGTPAPVEPRKTHKGKKTYDSTLEAASG
jgi:hypothetical protein